MALWLKRASSATGGCSAHDLGARVGVDSDVVRRETFGALVRIDEAYVALAADREAVLAAACDEAARIVERGKAEASKIIELAQSEYSNANELGFREGCDRALAEWMERVGQAADAQNKLQLSMRERIANIVASAVEQIVRVERHEELFERALAAVDRIVDGATYLRVFVHPDDHQEAAAVFERLAARWRDLGQPIPLSVVPDKRLEAGSCVCESDFGTVDASLETQLRAMRSAVLRGLKHSGDESADAVERGSFAVICGNASNDANESADGDGDNV